MHRFHSDNMECKAWPGCRHQADHTELELALTADLVAILGAVLGAAWVLF